METLANPRLDTPTAKGVWFDAAVAKSRWPLVFIRLHRMHEIQTIVTSVCCVCP